MGTGRTNDQQALQEFKQAIMTLQQELTLTMTLSVAKSQDTIVTLSAGTNPHLDAQIKAYLINDEAVENLNFAKALMKICDKCLKLKSLEQMKQQFSEASLILIQGMHLQIKASGGKGEEKSKHAPKVVDETVNTINISSQDLTSLSAKKTVEPGDWLGVASKIHQLLDHRLKGYIAATDRSIAFSEAYALDHPHEALLIHIHIVLYSVKEFLGAMTDPRYADPFLEKGKEQAKQLQDTLIALQEQIVVSPKGSRYAFENVCHEELPKFTAIMAGLQQEAGGIKDNPVMPKVISIAPPRSIKAKIGIIKPILDGLQKYGKEPTFAQRFQRALERGPKSSNTSSKSNTPLQGSTPSSPRTPQSPRSRTMSPSVPNADEGQSSSSVNSRAIADGGVGSPKSSSHIEAEDKHQHANLSDLFKPFSSTPLVDDPNRSKSAAHKRPPRKK